MFHMKQQFKWLHIMHRNMKKEIQNTTLICSLHHSLSFRFKLSKWSLSSASPSVKPREWIKDIIDLLRLHLLSDPMSNTERQ